MLSGCLWYGCTQLASCRVALPIARVLTNCVVVARDVVRMGTAILPPLGPAVLRFLIRAPKSC